MLPDKSTPKYEHAYRVILDRLKSERYSIGGRLPTEGELARQLNVSRMTMRRALFMLVQDGYIESRQGSGYTVLTLSPASDTCLTSFTDTMLRAGREPTSRFLSIAKFSGGAPELQSLPGDMRSQPVSRISRLRLVDDQPRMLVMTYALTKYLGDAQPQDFPERGPGQSILRILRARFKLDWHAACEDISPIAADDKMASCFGVEVGRPLLKLACTAFDQKGRSVFYEEVFRNGPVSFNLQQQSRGSGFRREGATAIRHA